MDQSISYKILVLSIDFSEDLNIFMYRRRLEMAQDGSEKAINGYLFIGDFL